MIFPLTSKKPILIVGDGLRSAGAAEMLNVFIEKTKIPVITSMNSVDLVQDKNRIGFFGIYGNRAANMIVNESDLIIAIGVRLGLRQIGPHPAEKFAPNAKLIRVDIDINEIERSIKINEEKYVMDAREFMADLLGEKIPEYAEWNKKCFKLRDYLEGYDDEVGNLAVKKIASLLPTNPIVAVDVGQNQCWSAQSLFLKGNEGRILIGGGYASMGCGLPYAIGASIVRNNEKVYCIIGDGGLQMNIQELETVVREKIPVKILVLNNSSLGKISEVQAKSNGSKFAQTTSSSGYSVPDFTKISLAYGIKSITLSNYNLLDSYNHWLLDDEACLINIMLPSDTKLIPKIEFHSYEVFPQIDYKTRLEAIGILT